MLKAMLKLINQQKQKSKKGFTLVELIVVIAILGILAALVVPQVTGYISKAQEATNQANAQMVYSAAQLYITDKDVAGEPVDAMSIDDLVSNGYIQKKLPTGDTATFEIKPLKTTVGDKEVHLKNSLVLTYTPNGKDPIVLGGEGAKSGT